MSQYHGVNPAANVNRVDPATRYSGIVVRGARMFRIRPAFKILAFKHPVRMMRGRFDLRTRHAALSPREREIMTLVCSGLMNKQVAAKMGVSEVTVKVHRHNLMKKLGARSLAELVRMADSLKE